MNSDMACLLHFSLLLMYALSMLLFVKLIGLATRPHKSHFAQYKIAMLELQYKND